MKITKVDADRLVLSQSQWGFRLVGVCLLGIAVAVVVLKSSTQVLRCSVVAADRSCVIVEENLVGGVTETLRISASDVRRVEIITGPDGDDVSHCVVIVTKAESHEVGRCSLQKEAYLSALAQKLKAFYAGERDSVENELSDAGFLWFTLSFPIIIGLWAILGPAARRVEFNRKSGLLTTRMYFVGRVRRAEIPLKRIRGVAVEFVIRGDDGERLNHLVAILTDDRRHALTKPAMGSADDEQAAIEEFLDATPQAYR